MRRHQEMTSNYVEIPAARKRKRQELSISSTPHLRKKPALKTRPPGALLSARISFVSTYCYFSEPLEVSVFQHDYSLQRPYIFSPLPRQKDPAGCHEDN